MWIGGALGAATVKLAWGGGDKKQNSLKKLKKKETQFK